MISPFDFDWWYHLALAKFWIAMQPVCGVLARACTRAAERWYVCAERCNERAKTQIDALRANRDRM